MSLLSPARRAARSRRRVTLLLAVTGLGVGLVAALPAAAADASAGRVSYPGSVPSFVAHAKAAGSGKVGYVEGEVYLPTCRTRSGRASPRDRGLDARQPGYGKYL